jgi:hypothetical protein
MKQETGDKIGRDNGLHGPLIDYYIHNRLFVCFIEAGFHALLLKLCQWATSTARQLPQDFRLLGRHKLSLLFAPLVICPRSGVQCPTPQLLLLLPLLQAAGSMPPPFAPFSPPPRRRVARTTSS